MHLECIPSNDRTKWLQAVKENIRMQNVHLKTYRVSPSKESLRLTEYLHLDRGLGLLVAILGHTLVDASAVHVGVVNGEGGRGFITATHKDVRPVGEDLLPTGGIPVDVFSISHHWRAENAE